MTKTPTIENVRRMTEAQGFALARQWRESGLSVSEFCRVHGVKAHRVWHWNGRLRQEESELTEKADEERFVVLSSEELAADADTTNDKDDESDAIEIVVGDQFVVRVRQRAGALADVLRALQGADR